MAFVVADRVAPARPTAIASYPLPSVVFGTCTTAGATPNVQWDNGEFASAVPADGLDKISIEDPLTLELGLVVRPTAAQVSDYDGVVIGIYNRTLNGGGTNKGVFVLVKLLNAPGYIELLESAATIVGGR